MKIRARILANHLQTALLRLVGLEQCRTVKDRIHQDSFHLVRKIIEKVDGNAALTNLDQSKAFGFL